MSQIFGYTIIESLFVTDRTRVFRAYKDNPNETVILRTCGERGASPGHAARLSFTNDVMQMFDHPNIVKSLDWVGRETQPCLVLEDIRGIDIKGYAAEFKDRQYPLDLFMNIAIQMAEALSVVHHAHVIHKDLHPGNIIVNPETGQVQIIDFGLASLLSREQPSLDTTDRLSGILAYLSPEQTGRMNRALDYRTDFYTLGITFYQMLSGKLPFYEEDALGLVYAHIAKTQTSLTEVRSDIPAMLAKIIDKCLMKNAEDRYQSALGLKKDLERVQQALQEVRIKGSESQTLTPLFELGQEDISDRFEIPQKLYGREADIDILLQAFNKASDGTPKILAISGTSGIGKSALVHEVHKPIAKNNGLFCSGKFDQFQKNVPYSALQQALKAWIQQKLSLPETQFKDLRAKIKEALGANARVLIDFIPDFALILGDLPEVAQLGASETQNRFHLVFQRFIQCITHDQPLALFIDDIQWADQGTLNLLPLLISEVGSRLLVIVAYRDNEVDEHHPSMQTLNQIKNATNLDGELSQLSLGPLVREEVTELLSDAFHVNDDEKVEGLTKLVVSKTGGNPFFINELLLTLYKEKLFNFDLNTQNWQWDLREINARGITGNIVDLMLEKMKRLPEETQTLIQLGACIGQSFDIDVLAKLTELSNNDVSKTLWPALKEGLLLQENALKDVSHFKGSDPLSEISESLGIARSQNPIGDTQSTRGAHPQSYRFLHDRMQQAAYESFSEAEHQRLHLKLGRLLLSKVLNKQKTLKDLNADTVFAIAEQLNKARSLITDKNERAQLAELNLYAGQKAWLASAWQAAATYAELGTALLEKEAWTEQFEITKQLYLLKAECDYLNGEQESSNQHYDLLFEKIEDQDLLADICSNRLVQCIGKGKWKEAIDFGVKGLDYLGIKLPDESEVKEAIQAELKYLHANSNQGLIEIDRLPEASQGINEALYKIYPNLSIGYLILGNHGICDYFAIKGAAQVIRDGRFDLGAIQLTTYALYLRRQEQLSLAYEQAVQAIKLAESYQPCRELSNIYNATALMTWYLKAPLSECVDLHIKGYELGLESGEIARALISYGATILAGFSRGENLKELSAIALSVMDLQGKKSVFAPYVGFIYQLSQALIKGQDKASEALNDETFDANSLSMIKQSMFYPGLQYWRAELAFWCEDEALALEQCVKVTEFGSLFPKGIYWVDHLFLYTLLLIRKDSPSEAEQTTLAANLAKMAEYAELNAYNFEHKHLLLQAEHLRSHDAPMKAVIKHYRLAIKSAAHSGFVQYEALVNELYAAYLEELGEDFLAESLIKRAYRCYKDWGCKVKTSKFKQRYPYLTQSRSKKISGWKSSGLSSSISRSYGNTITDDSSHDSRPVSELDMMSALKSTQAISDELELQNLIKKVMQVIQENAGAKLALLIIDSEEGPLIEGHVDENRDVANYLMHQKFDELDESERANFPRAILNRTLRSGESVQLHNAVSEGDFIEDEYVKRFEIKSALSLPIIYRESQIGALYLENNLTTQAFDNKRVDFMKILLGQVAISFENARLFNEVNVLNEDLEHKVEERTEELSKANDKLQLANHELDAYARTVSHDLRAPIRHIKNFTEILREDLEDAHKLDDDNIEMFDKIMGSSNKMFEMVSSLLELSHIQEKSLKQKPVDLAELVRAFFVEMRVTFPDQHVTTDCIDKAMVLVDEGMIKSVLVNLINNAYKYSSKKTNAHISFGRLEDGAEIPQGVGLVPDKISEGYAIFYVKDNGDGFNMKNARELFGSFQRMHHESEFEGTGIGLATVKRVIEKHGGRIWAEAYKGEGATFYFTLPLA